jgi:transmembrane sensor
MNDIENINNELNKGSLFKVDPPDYKRSKEDVWNELSKKIGDRKQSNLNSVSSKRNLIIFYSIAASLIIFLGTVLMMRFYSESLYCPEGQQITETLPDGSIIKLQPNTTLTYYPLWWRFSRRLVLSGEAFFDVKKGNDFIVSSPLGTTSVLGTSFSIHARSESYVVTCFTGRVQVVAFTKRSVVLDPNFTAELVKGDIKVTEYHGDNEPESIDSMMFDYKSAPLEMVINDMEEYYNVIVTSEVPLGYNYTGYFSKRKSIDEVLYIICKPYGLKSVKLSEKKYHIIKN